MRFRRSEDQLDRDIEKVVMYLDPPYIKYNNKKVVIL